MLTVEGEGVASGPFKVFENHWFLHQLIASVHCFMLFHPNMGEAGLTDGILLFDSFSIRHRTIGSMMQIQPWKWMIYYCGFACVLFSYGLTALCQTYKNRHYKFHFQSKNYNHLSKTGAGRRIDFIPKMFQLLLFVCYFPETPKD